MQTCTCTGVCKGEAGLGPNWVCALRQDQDQWRKGVAAVYAAAGDPNPISLCCASLAEKVLSLRAETERLVEFCRKQQDEIETLNGFADAVESLRDIGKVTGCDHVDGPDGRRQLINCVEQTIDALRLDVLKYRKILAFVPAKIAIAAKEKAGYPSVIRAIAVDQE